MTERKRQPWVPWVFVGAGVIMVIGVISALLSEDGNDQNRAGTPERPVSTSGVAEDECVTTYLAASAAATAALARADADLARSLDGLLAADDEASTIIAIGTATAARIAYDDATAAFADATGALEECARTAR